MIYLKRNKVDFFSYEVYKIILILSKGAVTVLETIAPIPPASINFAKCYTFPITN